MIIIPEPHPKRDTKRMQNVHRQQNEAPSRSTQIPRFHSGSGEIRTHGTLSRTHTFQASGVRTLSGIRRAGRHLSAENVRGSVQPIYERGRTQGRIRGVYSAQVFSRNNDAAGAA